MKNRVWARPQCSVSAFVIDIYRTEMRSIKMTFRNDKADNLMCIV